MSGVARRRLLHQHNIEPWVLSICSRFRAVMLIVKFFFPPSNRRIPPVKLPITPSAFSAFVLTSSTFRNNSSNSCCNAVIRSCVLDCSSLWVLLASRISESRWWRCAVRWSWIVGRAERVEGSGKREFRCMRGS